MSNAATAKSTAPVLTEQDLFVLHHFAFAVAQYGGSAMNVGCYSAEQLNRLIDAGAVAPALGGGWTLPPAGQAAVSAYRNRPDVKRNSKRAERAMRRHPAH